MGGRRIFHGVTGGVNRDLGGGAVTTSHQAEHKELHETRHESRKQSTASCRSHQGEQDARKISQKDKREGLEVRWLETISPLSLWDTALHRRLLASKNEHHQEHLYREIIEFPAKNTAIKTAREGGFDAVDGCCLCFTIFV